MILLRHMCIVILCFSPMFFRLIILILSNSSDNLWGVHMLSHLRISTTASMLGIKSRKNRYPQEWRISCETVMLSGFEKSRKHYGWASGDPPHNSWRMMTLLIMTNPLTTQTRKPLSSLYGCFSDGDKRCL